MTVKRTSLINSSASVSMRDRVPYSHVHDDIYYHKEQGLEESRTVFLAGANIEKAWHGKDHFAIGETGFGTGLNFLATLEAYQAANRRPESLSFFSFDNTPLSRSFLREAHAQVNAPTALSEALVTQLPPPAPGMHVRHFLDNRVTLFLYYGHAEAALQELSTTQDAWYLDGFSPAQNEGMWSTPVLSRIAELTKPGGRIATFTAAGFVRRALEAAGCTVERVKGFANKRHRTVATRLRSAPPPAKLAGNDTRWTVPPLPAGSKVAVVGAGIAGLSLATALKRYGFKPTVFDDPASPPASSVPAAILSPRLPADNTQARVNLMARAYAYALSYPMFKDFFMQPKGLLLCAEGDENPVHKMIETHQWGDDWWQRTPDGAFLPESGTLATTELLCAMRDNLELVSASVTGYERKGAKWHLQATSQKIAQLFDFDGIILATASPDLLPSSLWSFLSRTAGQTLWINEEFSTAPDAHSYMNGYYQSPLDPHRRKHLLGSTRHGESLEDLPDPAHAFSEKTGLRLPLSSVSDRWASTRFEVRDHMPLVGPLWDDDQMNHYLAPLVVDGRANLKDKPPFLEGLYCFTGFGSRGYQYAPLLAEILASRLAQVPVPSLQQDWPVIHPIRLATKQRKIGKSLVDA